MGGCHDGVFELMYGYCLERDRGKEVEERTMKRKHRKMRSVVEAKTAAVLPRMLNFVI